VTSFLKKKREREREEKKKGKLATLDVPLSLASAKCLPAEIFQSPASAPLCVLSTQFFSDASPFENVCAAFSIVLQRQISLSHISHTSENQKQKKKNKKKKQKKTDF
jgi:hypothetical protein